MGTLDPIFSTRIWISLPELVVGVAVWSLRLTLTFTDPSHSLHVQPCVQRQYLLRPPARLPFNHSSHHPLDLILGEISEPFQSRDPALLWVCFKNNKMSQNLLALLGSVPAPSLLQQALASASVLGASFAQQSKELWGSRFVSPPSAATA